MNKHTFGGRYFDRFIEFEPDDGLGDPVAPAIEGEVTPPAPAAPAAPAVTEPEPEVVPAAPVPLSREDVIAAAREAALEGSSTAFREMLAQADAQERARAAAVPAALPEWDPYDPQVVMAHTMQALTPLFRELEARANRGVDVAAQYEHQQGEQQANALLDSWKVGEKKIGEFDNARAIAAARLMLAVEPGLQPEEALKRAATAEVEYADALVAKRMEALGIVAENHRAVTPEPGSGAAAAAEAVTVPRGKDAYKLQLERSLAARGARPGVMSPA